MSREVTIDNVFVKAETDRAILCDIDGDEHWIPKSQISDDSEVYQDGDEGDLVITEWLANQKGL